MSEVMINLLTEKNGILSREKALHDLARNSVHLHILVCILNGSLVNQLSLNPFKIYLLNKTMQVA